MSEKTFIPCGDSFVTVLSNTGSFFGNVVATAPTSYLRIINVGSPTGGTSAPILARTVSNNVPFDVMATGAVDNFADTVNGTIIFPNETVIMGINNQPGITADTMSIGFAANLDLTGGATDGLVVVQPVKPV